MTTRTAGPSIPLPAGTVGRLLGRVSRDAFPCDDEAGILPGRYLARALPADGRAVSEARRFTGFALRDWALGHLADNAALIVSELLSNALRHGLAANPGARSGQPSAVWLGLLQRRGTVLFAVCDHSSSVPELREPDYYAQSGRGLHIIECLSEAWGWTTPDTDGKAVWAAVSCPRASARAGGTGTAAAATREP
ncbi:ATP-binding protein [Streptomyces sp. 8L]|uniref:ATP-binding protein n=1 Tax=Streptomyces sp. 8L TaxID=2877242 RepID=UPI001CD547FC|nr:ATP-binding protein [Streptomyces sp. 8L]MCA1219777.1 ATP-binding protein [Streptomyces sp. 8L]